LFSYLIKKKIVYNGQKKGSVTASNRIAYISACGFCWLEKWQQTSGISLHYWHSLWKRQYYL